MTSKEHTYIKQDLNRLFPLLIFVSTLVLNIWVLDNKFLYWDDGLFYFDNAALKVPWDSWSSLKWIFTLDQTVRLTPVSWVLIKGIYEIWGNDPTGIRILALSCHLLNSLLIFKISEVILRKCSLESSSLLAGLCTLVWVCNPLRVETVAWATSVTYTVSTALALLAILILLRNKKDSRKRDILAYGLFIISNLAYPNTLFLSLSGLPLVYLRRDGEEKNIPFSKFDIVIYFAAVVPSLVITVLTVHYAVLSNNLWTVEREPVGVIDRLNAIIAAILYQFFTAIVPPKEITPGHYPGETLWQPKQLIGLLLIGYIIYQLRTNFRKKAAAICLICLVALIPVINITAPDTLPTDRHTYLVSFFILLALITVSPAPKNHIFYPLILSYSCFLALVSFKQHGVWENTDTLIAHLETVDVVEKNDEIKGSLLMKKAAECIDNKEYAIAFALYGCLDDLNNPQTKNISNSLREDLVREVFSKRGALGPEAENFLTSESVTDWVQKMKSEKKLD